MSSDGSALTEHRSLIEKKSPAGSSCVHGNRLRIRLNVCLGKIRCAVNTSTVTGVPRPRRAFGGASACSPCGTLLTWIACWKNSVGAQRALAEELRASAHTGKGDDREALVRRARRTMEVTCRVRQNRFRQRKRRGARLELHRLGECLNFPILVDISGAHASWESFSCDSFELDEGSVSGCGADAGRNRPNMAQMKRQIFLWARSTLALKLLSTVTTHLSDVPCSLASTASQVGVAAWVWLPCFYGGASAVSPGIEFPLCPVLPSRPPTFLNFVAPTFCLIASLLMFALLTLHKSRTSERKNSRLDAVCRRKKTHFGSARTRTEHQQSHLSRSTQTTRLSFSFLVLVLFSPCLLFFFFFFSFFLFRFFFCFLFALAQGLERPKYISIHTNILTW